MSWEGGEGRREGGEGRRGGKEGENITGALSRG